MRIPWVGRGSPPAGGRKWRLLLVPAMGLAVICQLSVAGSVAATAATTAKAAVTSVAPNPVNELDCNGWSPKYGTVRKLAGDLCTDPIKVVNGKGQRFVDNGWYVGPRRAQRQVHLKHAGLRQHDDLPDEDPGGPA